MELRDYIRILRYRWVTVVIATLVTLLLALLYVGLSPKTYQARAKAFVSVIAGTKSTDPANSINAGAQFALGQMKSYTQLSDSGQVLQPVIDTLKLNETVSDLAQKTSVTNPAGTAILLVDASDSNAHRAAQVANATAASLAQVIKSQQSAGGGTSYLNVDVTTEASVPGSAVSPARNLDLLLALFIGLAIGLTLATVRERLDRSVQTPEQLRDLLGEEPGVMPPISDRGSVPFAVLDDRGARAINAFRSVRVALALGNRGSLPARIVVVSPNPADGRTAFACNLAISAAEAGTRVCLVEAVRTGPSMATDLGIEAEVGLAEVLAGTAGLDAAIHDWHGLMSVLTVGSPGAIPDAMMATSRMRTVIDDLSGRYDTVIIDTPALATCPDGLILAQHASGARHARPGEDGVVILGRVGHTRPEQLASIRDVMRAGGAHVLGIVLNTVPAPPWQRPRIRARATASKIRARLLDFNDGKLIPPLPPGEVSVFERAGRTIAGRGRVQPNKTVTSTRDARGQLGPTPSGAAEPAELTAEERVLQAVSAARGTASTSAIGTRPGDRE